MLPLTMLGIEPRVEAFWLHTVHRADPAHRWPRETLTNVGREIEHEAGNE